MLVFFCDVFFLPRLFLVIQMDVAIFKILFANFKTAVIFKILVLEIVFPSSRSGSHFSWSRRLFSAEYYYAFWILICFHHFGEHGSNTCCLWLYQIWSSYFYFILLFLWPLLRVRHFCYWRWELFIIWFCFVVSDAPKCGISAKTNMPSWQFKRGFRILSN